MLFSKFLLMASVVLFLILSSMPMFSSSSLPKTMKKLNEPTALSCKTTCPGLMKWRRGGELVAECGNGAKEEDFSLTCESNQDRNILSVPEVNFFTAGIYSAFCENVEERVCRQILSVIPPEFNLELRAGDHLRLDLHNLKTGRITFAKPGNSSVMVICSVKEDYLQCSPEYQERVLLLLPGNVFKMKDMKPSDSGNYSVQDQYDTLLSSSYLSVKDVPQNESSGYWLGFHNGALCFGIGMLFFGVILERFVLSAMIYHIRKIVRRLRKRNSRKNEDNMEKEKCTELHLCV